MSYSDAYAENRYNQLKSNLIQTKKSNYIIYKAGKVSEHSECDISYSNFENANRNDENFLNNLTESSFEIKDENGKIEDLKVILQKLKCGIELKKHSNMLFKTQNYVQAREGYLKV